MAQRELEPEVITIFEHINNDKNFLLSGGAGSGKTYSLVHVIKEIIDREPTATVACMTYTNAAVKEIEERELITIICKLAQYMTFYGTTLGFFKKNLNNH